MQTWPHPYSVYRGISGVDNVFNISVTQELKSYVLCELTYQFPALTSTPIDACAFNVHICLSIRARDLSIR